MRFLPFFQREIFIAMPDNLMYTKQRYPGVAQLVARQLWELDSPLLAASVFHQQGTIFVEIMSIMA